MLINPYWGKTMIELLGGRKFLLAMFSLVSTTTLVWFGHISDGVYSAVIIATCGSYFTGNVAQKIGTKPVI